jgi:hypothetical protein
MTDVTGAQLSRLDAKVDALAVAIDTDSRPITVVVFQGEARGPASSRRAAAVPGRPAGAVRASQ